jgi:hypothetical protein
MPRRLFLLEGNRIGCLFKWRDDLCVVPISLRDGTAPVPPHPRARLGKYESDGEGTMRRDLVRWLGLGVAIGIAFQPAQAGERKSAIVQRAAVSAPTSNFGGQMRSSGINQAAAPLKMHGRGELAFFQVTPFESRSAGAGEKASRQREDQNASGPTSPRERRAITLLRFNPNISVQPVIGGVNGAQLSVGF